MGIGVPLPSRENIPICISLCRILKDFFVDPTADEVICKGHWPSRLGTTTCIIVLAVPYYKY